MIIQEQAISYILDSKDTSFITENALSADYFYNYKDEFNYIKSYLNTYQSIPDKATFADKFPSFEFLDVKESTKFLLDELSLEKSRYNFRVSLKKSAELYNSDKFEEAIAYMQNALDTVRNNKSVSCIDIVHDTSRYESFLEMSTNFDTFFVTTGFKELDEFLGGGWNRKEELAVIMARPGVGKSWVLLCCAIACVKRGLKVGLYSGEMSAESVAFRFDTLLGHLSNRDISHGNIAVQNEYKQFLDTLSTQVTGSLKILTPSDIGDFATVDDLQAFIERENLDALFIDQHSLLKDRNNAKNPVEKASNISTDLKKLQVLKKIPLIAVSQMNRPTRNGEEASEEEDFDVGRLAQSDKIGQDCTALVGLSQKDGVLTMYLSKSRNSVANKKLKYMIDYNIGKFDYIPIGEGEGKKYQEDFDSGESDDFNDVFTPEGGDTPPWGA